MCSDKEASDTVNGTRTVGLGGTAGAASALLADPLNYNIVNGTTKIGQLLVA